MIQLLLQQCGAQITAVDSVSEALTTLNQYRPDLLISDIDTPGEDGYRLIRQLRDQDKLDTVGLPAISLTAYASDQDKKKALAACFFAHLPKPVESFRLVTTVANLMSIQKA